MTPKTENKDAKEAPQAKGQGDRVLLIELSCKDKKCTPCTYPNCQRFASEKLQGKKKAPFKVKVTELQKDMDVKKVLSGK
jgi:hypothetical protein